MLNNKKKLQKYFKLAAYKIFKIIYGEVKGKTSHLDNDEINLKKVKLEIAIMMFMFVIIVLIIQIGYMILL